MKHFGYLFKVGYCFEKDFYSFINDIEDKIDFLFAWDAISNGK